MEPLIPIDDNKPEETSKTKKKLSKKAKLAIIISAAVVAALGIAALLIFVVFKKEEPEVILTDRDILTSISWEKQDAPTVIWTFHTDGTGEITTNKSNYYDTSWSLNDEDEAETTLDITTSWLYELKDSFTFKMDREANTFMVKNLADETESTFVPLGTAEKAATEQHEGADELDKTEE